ncbi:MAG: adenylate/guanylate cyclase domain-containing protein [Candidatus Rifleibacteriota bacterium]
MKLPRLLAVISSFVFIFILILILQGNISRSEKSSEDFISQAYTICEEMQYKADVDLQIQQWFAKFREELNEKPGTYFQGWKEPEFLAHNLPPHTLAIAEASEDGRMLRFANIKGNMKEGLAELFVLLSVKYKVKFSDYILKKEFSDKLEECNDLLQDFIGFDAARMNMIVLRSSRMSVYNDVDHRNVWFYWDRFQKKGGGEFFIFSKIRVEDLEPYYAYRSYLKNNLYQRFSCAYYNEEKRTFIASRDFERKVDEDSLKAISRAAASIEKKHADQSEMQFTRLKTKSKLIILGRYIGMAGLRPVVAFDLPARNYGKLADPAKLPFLVILSLVVVFLVNALVFDRGPVVRVGFVLLMAISFAILMPFFLGQSVFDLILKEAYEKERLKIERDLHQTLIGIDSGFKFNQLNLAQRIEEIFKRPEIINKLHQEEVSSTSADLQNSITAELVEIFFADLTEGYSEVPEQYRTLNALIIAGPNGFIRYFNKYRDKKIFSENTLDTIESMYIILTTFKNQLFKLYPEESFDPEFYQQHQKDSESKIEKLKFEEIRDKLQKSLGPEKFHEIMYSKVLSMTLRSTLGRTLITSYPVKYKNKYRYFASVVWDEFSVCPTYLRRAFDLRLKADKREIEASENSFFQKLDPANYISRKPIVLMAYDGFRFDAFSTLDNEPQVLSNLTKDTYRSKMLLKHETSGKDASLYEIFPGKNMSVYVIGAKQNITHLQQIRRLRTSTFIIAMIIYLIFAFFAAKNLSRSFTSPLQHILWGLNRVEKNDYSVRLKANREDEFGSISRAFNNMTRRLSEKDLLGKFVSDPVKRLAADPELLLQACEGVEEEVTIVFARLENFSELALQTREDEARQYLEFSLSKFFKRVEECGGEIDKVIGSQLLIVFFHRKLGKKKAVEAAKKLAETITKDFAGKHSFKPVFGVNMGRVISGIIGAPSVRMDYTIIGDPVNVAARLCSLANSKNRPIIISGQVKEILGEDVKAERINIEKVRGKRQEVKVFSLFS